VGQYGALAGLAVLLITLFIFWSRPNWMLASTAVGYLCIFVGGLFADRYAGLFAHHEALAEKLKYLGGRYTLLQYVLPASHVLLEPGGCTVFVIKTQGGQVTCRDGKWEHRQRSKFLRLFAGQKVVGNPHLEAEREARKLERWLTKRLPDADIPVRPVVLFVNPDVTLEVNDAPVPVFYGKKVKAWLRGPGKLEPLPSDVHSRLAKVLGVG